MRSSGVQMSRTWFGAYGMSWTLEPVRRPAVLEEAATLTIFMRDRRVLSARTEPAKGSPRNAMTYDEVADKFRTNAEFAKWPTQKAESIIMLVQSLESAPTLDRLTAALTA